MVKIPMEIYSRCVGYMRPVSQWNKGKKEEFKNRVTYKIPISSEEVCGIILNQ